MAIFNRPHGGRTRVPAAPQWIGEFPDAHSSATDGLTRRQLLAGAVVLAAGGAMAGASCKTGSAAAVELPPLPYAENALSPYISSNTLHFHYGKHQQGYIDTCNRLLAGSELAGESLEAIVAATTGDPAQVALFNAAAQAWNHDFYFRSMRPKGGGMPRGAVADKIAAAFGTYGEFRRVFSEAATTLFGSGWAWLVLTGDQLRIATTTNAETPITSGAVPLLTIDVWEHAYYLDYQNRRADYVAAWLDNLVDWDFAAANLDRAA